MSVKRRVAPRLHLANLPNVITFVRILLVPVLVLLLTDPGRTASVLAALTFFLACWSDFFDGYLARRWNISTTFGKLLDPLADKLIVAAALIMLVGVNRQPRVPGWMAVIIIGREIAVTGLRAIAVGEGVVLAAEELGKYKMVFQMFAVFGLLLHYDFLRIDFHAAGMYFLWISMILAIWSAIDYHVKVIRQITHRPASS